MNTGVLALIGNPCSVTHFLTSLSSGQEGISEGYDDTSEFSGVLCICFHQTQHMVFTCPLHQHLIDDLEHSTAVTAASFNSQLTYTTSIMPAQNMLPHLVHKATAWGRAPPQHAQGREKVSGPEGHQLPQKRGMSKDTQNLARYM